MSFSIPSRSLQLQRPSRANSSGFQSKGKMRVDFISIMLVPQPKAWIWKGRASSKASDPIDGENVIIMDKDDAYEMVSDRVDYLVQILHKSAKSFSIAVQSSEMARNGSQLAKAWIGVDVHAWHKHIAYQAAIYALLQTAIEPGLLLYDKYGKDQAPLHKIISPKIIMLQEYIESQLNARDPKLMKWFQKEQLSILSVFFTPSLRRLAVEFSKSGVAVIVLAICCCIAVGKLGAARMSCPMFTLSVPAVTGELMDLLHSIVPIENVHHLALEAGFESEFLAHFGPKVMHHDRRNDVVFWITLIQKKICVAFRRESVAASLQIFCNTEVLEQDLITLGIFAFFGRKTRLFLSCMGIKDIDEQLKDFLSYLECGSLFIYPELSSISMYQLFMEVITEEIGWLEFYAAVPCITIRHQERRRSKQHAIQAEKEIILSTVFNVCSDMFSSFGHFSKSTQQPLDANLVAFLLQSQNLLNICLEDYLAAYDKSSEVLKITEVRVPDLKASLGHQGTMNASMPFERHLKPADIMMMRITEYRPQRISRMSKFFSSNMMDAVVLERQPCDAKTNPVCQSLFRKSTNKLISTCSDIWMGTRLLFIDMSIAVGLLHKKICGRILTKREGKKLMRTISDVASVIPLAILMLLPVSAVGHAAIIAGIKKYIPSLIPSPYSSERLDVAKQLNRTKKMEVQSWGNLDVSSSIL